MWRKMYRVNCEMRRHWNWMENPLDDGDDLRFSWNEIVLKLYLSHFYLCEIRCAQCDNHIPKEWQNDMMFPIWPNGTTLSIEWPNQFHSPSLSMATSRVSIKQTCAYEFVEHNVFILEKIFSFYGDRNWSNVSFLKQLCHCQAFRLLNSKYFKEQTRCTAMEGLWAISNIVAKCTNKSIWQIDVLCAVVRWLLIIVPGILSFDLNAVPILLSNILKKKVKKETKTFAWKRDHGQFN